MTDNERKETISALRQLLAMCDFLDQYGDSIDADPYFDAVETVIESLNKTRWIPCSERLPSDGDAVIVSVIDDHGDTPWCYTDVAWLCNGTWIADNEILFGYVIAWMPLPDIYREDGEARTKAK